MSNREYSVSIQEICVQCEVLYQASVNDSINDARPLFNQLRLIQRRQTRQNSGGVGEVMTMTMTMTNILLNINAYSNLVKY